MLAISSPPHAFVRLMVLSCYRIVGPSGFLLGAFVLAAHLLYSPLGFNPTDDGLQLAFARRVADGEVPHRDFISVRPPLSYYLWAPALLLGDHVILGARAVVWLEWALVTWIWTRLMVRRVLRHALMPAEELALAAVGFMVGSHSFALMPWHTVDGLLLLSVGLALTKSRCAGWRILGWGIVGMAPVVKQSFAPAVPLLLLLGRDRGRWWAWASGLAPAVAYVVAMFACGALEETVKQLTANPRFLATALLTYPVTYPFFPFVVGSSAVWMWAWQKWRRRAEKALAFMVLAAAAIVPPLAFLNVFVPQSFSIHLFAVALGLGVGGALVRPSRVGSQARSPVARRVLEVLGEGLVVAWASAISVAVNFPALAAGILWCALFALLFRQWRTVFPLLQWRRWAALGLVLVTAVAFHYGRTHLIYRERPASELTARLDGILPGAAGVRTNPRTRELLAELRDLATSATQTSVRYALLPDCAAWWIAAPQTNPLPFVWDNEVELPAPLRARVIEALAHVRGPVRFFVTRYETDSLAELLRPLLPRYPATQALRSMMRKVGQTTYFDIYAPFP